MSRAVYMDCERSYRLGIPTCFYDRVVELDSLKRLIDGSPTIIVWGPRNSGKSTLLKYISVSGIEGYGLVYVDSRSVVARRFKEAFMGFGGFEDAMREVGFRLASIRVSLEGLINAVEEALARFKKARRILVIDEFHLLGEDKEGLVRVLEALVKHVMSGTLGIERLLLATSEGFIALSNVKSRLSGYGVSYLLVEGMDEAHMNALYADYVDKHGCSLSLKAYTRLYGTMPGYILASCHLDRKGLEGLIIDEAIRVNEIILDISSRLSIKIEDALWNACSIIGSSLSTLKPEQYPLYRALLEANVVYPGGDWSIKPQIPLYRELICRGRERGAITPGIALEIAKEAI